MIAAVRASAARNRRSITAEIEHIVEVVFGHEVPIEIGDEADLYDSGGRTTAFLPAVLNDKLIDLANRHGVADSRALRSVLAHGLAAMRERGCAYCSGRTAAADSEAQSA